MSSIRDLVGRWEDNAKGLLTDDSYEVRLTLEDAAKMDALSEMYPRRTKEQLLSELVSAALSELEKSFPYIASHEIATHDEFGDPVFKDNGQTPAFQKLTRKHLAEYKQRAANS